ncbi:hypothetical protein ACH5RR_003677 [Cinchona calisaya]|uniref:Uncharacterized protein n=1 Tax=Cinchona calisaya TaxID=153742 RepID=A0ABD3AVL1_9GENT
MGTEERILTNIYTAFLSSEMERKKSSKLQRRASMAASGTSTHLEEEVKMANAQVNRETNSTVDSDESAVEAKKT